MKNLPRWRNWLIVGAIMLASLAAIPLAAFSQTTTQSDFVSRKAWRAKPAVTKLMSPHKITGIMIHHTSVRQQPKISLGRKMRGLQGFSMRTGKVGRARKPAWGDVPYHFYIGVSGRTAEGRALAYAGDTNTKYNTTGWIQVVLEGDFKTDHPKPQQLAALRSLIANLKARYGISSTKISGHNDHASTDCPGPNLKKYLPSLR